MVSEKFLSARQAASLCQVNFKTVLKWIAEGRLKAYQLPGSGVNRIRTGDFIAFLQKSGLPVPQSIVGGPVRVLIVDDEPSAISMLKRLFRAEDFLVDSAGDGFEAGRKLESFRPDIILLDLKMPGMSGQQVLQQIKGNPVTASVRVIILSGFVDDDEKRVLLNAGAEGVLSKPVERGALLSMMGVLSTGEDRV